MRPRAGAPPCGNSRNWEDLHHGPTWESACTLLIATLPTILYRSQPVSHLALRLVSVGTVSRCLIEPPAQGLPSVGVGCCEKLTEFGEGSVFCNLSALCSPDRLRSATLEPHPTTITRQGQSGLSASPVLSPKAWVRSLVRLEHPSLNHH